MILLYQHATILSSKILLLIFVHFVHIDTTFRGGNGVDPRNFL